MVAEKMNEFEMDLEESKYFEERWAEPLKPRPITDEEIEKLKKKGLIDDDYVKKFIRKV